MEIDSALSKYGLNKFWVLLLTFFILSAGVSTWAATLTWTGGAGDGSINTAGNWSPAQAPATGDTLIFEGNAGTAPQEGSNLNVGSLTFGATASAFTLGGAGVYTVGAGGIINKSAVAQTINNAITLGAAQTWLAYSGALGFGGAIANAGFLLTIDGSFNTAVSSIISGTGGITKTGSGALTLSAANTYTGATTINAGTVTLDYATVGSKLADTSILALGGGTLNLANGASAHNEVIASTTINSGASSVTRTSGTSVLRMNVITRNAGGTINFGAASIADTDTSNVNGILGGWATVAGADWAASATSAADTAISALSSYTAFGTSSATSNQIITSNGSTSTGGNYSVNSLKIAPTGSGGILSISGSNKQLIITSGGILFVGSNNYTLAAANANESILGASNGELIIQQFSTGNLTISAAIANNGTSGFVKAGTGTVTLSGANTYTGLTTVSAGTLAYGASNVISTGGVTVSGAAATLDLGVNHTDTVGLVTVDNGGSITGSGTSALTSTGTFEMKNGTVSAVLAGTGIVLNKTTADTVTLSGANTYTGATNINAGILALGSSGALGGNGSITFGGGTLQFSASNTSDYSAKVVSSTSAIALDTNSQNVTLATSLASSNTGGLTKLGAGTLTLSVSNTYTGVTTLNAGTLVLGATGALGTANVSAITFTGGTLQHSAGNTADYSAHIKNSTDAISIDTNAQSVTYASVMDNSNTGGLTKLGTGTLTLSVANTYTGLTTVSAGTLAYGASNVISTGAVTVSGATAILDLGANHTDTVGIVTVDSGGSITGSGTSALTSTGTFEMKNGTVSAILAGTGIVLNKTTAGTVTLSGANTYTGLTTVSAGTLAYGASNVMSTGAVTVSGATAILDLGANHTDTVGIVTVDSGGSITGSGTSALTSTGTFEMKNGTVSAILAGTGIVLNKTTAGTVTLSGANTYTGATNINAGVLSLGSSGALGTVSTISFGGGTLQYSASNTTDYSSRFSTAAGQAYNVDTNGRDVTFAGALTSSGGTFAKSGAGILTLSSASNTYSGMTTVNDGTFELDGVVPGGLTINNGGTLAGIGSTSGNVSIQSVGHLMPGQSGGSSVGIFRTTGTGNVTLAASGAAMDFQIAANGIAFANQSTNFLTGGGQLRPPYTSPANIVAGANDRLIVAGALNLIAGGKINITFNSGYTPTMGDGFDFLDWGSINLNGFKYGGTTAATNRFRLGGATENASFDLILPDISSTGLAYDTSLFASNGIIAIVPEPARALLFVIGLGAMLMRRRRNHATTF